MVTIAALLYNCQNKPIPPWPISISALLSLFVTIMKGAMAVPLAEGISQLEWSWFRSRDHELKDFVAFDEASRGPWGAGKLILLFRTW